MNESADMESAATEEADVVGEEKEQAPEPRREETNPEWREVQEWLEDVDPDLVRYKRQLFDGGFRKMKAILNLSHDLLKEIGITLPGDRAVLMGAVAKLRDNEGPGLIVDVDELIRQKMEIEREKEKLERERAEVAKEKERWQRREENSDEKKSVYSERMSEDTTESRRKQTMTQSILTSLSNFSFGSERRVAEEQTPLTSSEREEAERPRMWGIAAWTIVLLVICCCPALVVEVVANVGENVIYWIVAGGLTVFGIIWGCFKCLVCTEDYMKEATWDCCHCCSCCDGRLRRLHTCCLGCYWC